MVTQNFPTQDEAETEAERMRAIGLPVSVLRVRLLNNGQVERVWQVVVPYDYAAFAGCEIESAGDDEPSD